MNPSRLLICTNGAPASLPALEYGIWLNGILDLGVDLIGILEEPQHEKELESVLGSAKTRLLAQGTDCQVQVVRGKGELTIADLAGRQKWITVFGPLGRSISERWLRGRSFRRVLAKTAAPLLYVRSAHNQLRKILIPMGGLGFAREVEGLSLYLASRAGADVRILHIVETGVYDYPVASELQENWAEILETDTPQGRNLRQALEYAQTAGAAGGFSADFHVRQGNVIHEIVKEARDGQFDLVALGSQYSAQSLRHLYMPNVTAEVAEALEIPVATVRYGYQPG
jgi:nucleotide-binding universal stress UspA family protein